MIKGRKQAIWGVAFLIVAGVAIATGFTISCDSCGNSNSDRLLNTRNMLHDTTALAAVVGQLSTGDTFTVLGGDGSRGQYKLYSAYASIRFGCVSSCTAADWESEMFIMPTEGGDGGGGGGGGGGFGGGYDGGGGGGWGGFGGGGGCETIRSCAWQGDTFLGCVYENVGFCP